LIKTKIVKKYPWTINNVVLMFLKVKQAWSKVHRACKSLMILALCSMLKFLQLDFSKL